MQELINLTLVISLLVACLLICLGKWKVLGWLETRYFKNLCLFCLGFWLAAVGYLAYTAFYGFNPVLALAPFMAAPLVRFIIGSFKI